jgi:hypothetical protein
MIDAFAHRVDAATIAMFESAPDASYADLPLVNTTLLAVIFGTVRNSSNATFRPLWRPMSARNWR